MSFTLIETKTLGTAAAQIEFTSIPQTFTDLVFMASCRTDRAEIVDSVVVNINGSSADLTMRNLAGDGSSAFSNTATNAVFAAATGSTATANTFASSTTYIPNYSGSTNKSISTDQVTENNATAAFQILRAILRSNTAAITSVEFLPLVGSNLVAGTTISLYGILKGSDGIVTTS